MEEAKGAYVWSRKERVSWERMECSMDNTVPHRLQRSLDFIPRWAKASKVFSMDWLDLCVCALYKG